MASETGRRRTTWIVCGGRVGRNLTKMRVWAILDFLAEHHAEYEIAIVHGGAVWVDDWSGAWARKRGHIEIEVRITGEKDGYTPSAPFNRNQRMLDEHKDADFCLGFPGGGGTFDMMDRCHNAGVEVADIEIEDDGTFDIKWWPQKT